MIRLRPAAQRGTEVASGGLFAGLAVGVLAWVCFAGFAAAQEPDHTRWYLSEGAAGSFFSEEILILNASSTAADVRITYFRAAGDPVSQSLVVAPTSRATVFVNDVLGPGDHAVSALVQSVNGVPIVVERSMYWPQPQHWGGHNSPGLQALEKTWFLAEGSTGFFDTFVLLANPSTRDTRVRVTFLEPDGTTVVLPERLLAAQTRQNVWVNTEVPSLAGQAFGTIVESLDEVPIAVERAMYFGGPQWEAGHGSVAVAQASRTWYFAEGYTGATASLAYDTFFLLSNPGPSVVSARLTFLREGAEPLVQSYELLPRSRLNVWTNRVPGLASRAFGLQVEASDGIVVERSVYWGGPSGWVDAHNTPGVTALSDTWAFAEGAEDIVDEANPHSYDTYVLVGNASAEPLPLRFRFYREDGTGLARDFVVPPASRFTLPAAWIPELTNQRFATVVESTNGAPFIAERAMYWGDGYIGGHASTGVPWTRDAADAPPPPDPALAGVSPSAGSTLGGTVLWLTGSNFRADSAVRIGGVPAITTVLGARTLQAVAPPQGPGLRDVTVVSGALESTLTGAFTYVVTFPVVSSVTPGVGPSTGGTTVVLKGADLRDVSAVLFGGVPVERLDILDPRTIRVTTAPHAAGPVSVEVRRSDGLRGELPAAYTYTPATATDRVLAFGDSITWGTTSSALDLGGTIFLTSFRVPAGQDFPSGLQAALAAKYPGQMVSVVNSGVPGECASCPGQGAARFPGTLTPDLDLVLVLEGVNDTIARSPTAAIASSLRSMVLDAQARGKAVMIGTLLPIYRRADRGPDCSEDQSSLSYCYKANPAQATQINQEIRAIAAATGAILVDFHKEFLADPSLISPDGLHPTAAGYSRMAEVLSRIVVSSFEARRPVVP